MEKVRTTHMKVSIDIYRWDDERLVLMFPNEGTGPDIRSRLRQMKEDGFTFVPCCENTDEHGECQGHGD